MNKRLILPIFILIILTSCKKDAMPIPFDEYVSLSYTSDLVSIKVDNSNYLNDLGYYFQIDPENLEIEVTFENGEKEITYEDLGKKSGEEIELVCSYNEEGYKEINAVPVCPIEEMNTLMWS